MNLRLKNTKHTKMMIAAAVAGCALMIVPEMAMAETAGEAARRIEEEFTALKSFLISAGQLFGVFLVIVSLFLFNKEGKQPGQDHGKKGAIALAIGCCLLVIPWVVEVGTTTISSESAVSKIESDSGF
jgi:threonine/homoserine/homoserine lactone efflux protein